MGERPDAPQRSHPSGGQQTRFRGDLCHLEGGGRPVAQERFTVCQERRFPRGPRQAGGKGSETRVGGRLAVRKSSAPSEAGTGPEVEPEGGKLFDVQGNQRKEVLLISPNKGVKGPRALPQPRSPAASLPWAPGGLRADRCPRLATAAGPSTPRGGAVPGPPTLPCSICVLTQGTQETTKRHLRCRVRKRGA